MNIPNPVYKSINKALTVMGVERRLFFVAMVMGAATFTCFSSLLAAVLMFAVLYLAARQATKIDDQILKILLNSSTFKPQYDPLKRTHYQIQRVTGKRTASDGIL
jgi:type IV secretory pathway VirB3-like protein